MLQFQHQIKLQFKTWKNQASITLAMVHVIMTTPHGHCNGNHQVDLAYVTSKLVHPFVHAPCTMYAYDNHICVLSVEEHLTTNDYGVATTFEQEWSKVDSC